MIKKAICLLFIFFIFNSCKTASEKKENGSIKNNNNVIENKTESSPVEIIKKKEEVKKEYYDIEINVINGKSTVSINSQKKGITPLRINIEKGIYDLVLSREGYPDQICRMEVNAQRKFIFRHSKNKIPIKQIGIFECGSQPKQVIFSPDDNYIFIPLLDDTGFQVFDMNELKVTKFINPPDQKHRKGYAEGIFIKQKNTFCISQMSGIIYEYSYPDLKFIRTISTGGLWSKYITYTDIFQYIAISNWSSNNVSIIDYITGKILKKIPTPASPRGLAFSKDSKYFFVTSFDGGKIMKFETEKWKEIKSIYINNAAMRHIVLNDDNSEAFVSNMYHSQIYEINLKNFNIILTYNVDYNPNTIDLTPDNKYLIVSSRGPNNSVSYLERSPRNGTITVIDAVNKKRLFAFEGGNQPTGLDISNNGKYLCFSNFLDNNMEIYWIGDLL